MKVRLSAPYYGTAAPGTVLPLRDDAPLLHEGHRVGQILSARIDQSGDLLLYEVDIADQAVVERLTASAGYGFAFVDSPPPKD